MTKRISKKGFTLIEVIISVALVGIIAISFIAVFTGGFRLIMLSGRTTEKLFIAQEETEAKYAMGIGENDTSISIAFPSVSITLPSVSGTIEPVSVPLDAPFTFKSVNIISFFPDEQFAFDLVNLTISNIPAHTFDPEIYIYSYTISNSINSVTVTATPATGTYVTIDTVLGNSKVIALGNNTTKEVSIRVFDSGDLRKPINYRIYIKTTN